jgi:hypothetical protein
MGIRDIISSQNYSKVYLDRYFPSLKGLNDEIDHQ